MRVDFTKGSPCCCCMRQMIRGVSFLVKTDICKFFCEQIWPNDSRLHFRWLKTVPYDDFRMDGTVNSPLALIVLVDVPSSRAPTRACRWAGPRTAWQPFAWPQHLSKENKVKGLILCCDSHIRTIPSLVAGRSYARVLGETGPGSVGSPETRLSRIRITRAH